MSAVSFIEPEQPDQSKSEEKHICQQPAPALEQTTQIKPGSFKRKRSISTSSIQREDEDRTADEEQDNPAMQHLDMSRFKRSKSGRERSNSTCQASSTIGSNTGLIPVDYHLPPTTSTSSMALPMKKSLQGTRFKYLRNLGHHSLSMVNDLHLTNLPPTVRKLIEKKARRTRNSQSESESDVGTGHSNTTSSYGHHPYSNRNIQQHKEGKVLSKMTDVEDSELDTHFNIEQQPSHADAKQAIDHSCDQMEVDSVDKNCVSDAAKDFGDRAASAAGSVVDHVGLSGNSELVVGKQNLFAHKEEEEEHRKYIDKKKELSSTQSSFHSIPSLDVSMISALNRPSSTIAKTCIETTYETLSRTEFNELSTTDNYSGKCFLKQDSTTHSDASLDDSFRTVNETMNISENNPPLMQANLISDNYTIHQKDNVMRIDHEQVKKKSLDNLNDSVSFQTVVSEERSLERSLSTLSKNLHPSKEEAFPSVETPGKTVGIFHIVASSSTKSHPSPSSFVVTKSSPLSSSVGLDICEKPIMTVAASSKAIIGVSPSSSISLCSPSSSSFGEKSVPHSVAIEVYSKPIMTTSVTSVTALSKPSATSSFSSSSSNKVCTSSSISGSINNSSKVTETRKAASNTTSRLDIGDLTNANITKKKEDKASKRKKGGGLIPGESLYSVP